MQLDDVLIEIDLSTGRLHDDKGWPIGGSHGKTVFKGLTVFDIVDDFCTPENIRKRDIASIDSSSLSSSSTSSSSSSSSPSSSSSSPAGAIGPVGAVGPVGPAGAAGAVGTDGPAGAAGIASLSEFAFIYNLAAQVVAVESAVVFSDNGVLSAGITHALKYSRRYSNQRVSIRSTSLYLVPSRISLVCLLMESWFQAQFTVLAQAFSRIAATSLQRLLLAA